MISRISAKDYDSVISIIKSYKLQNTYLYVDAITYGLDGKDICCYIQKIDGKIYTVVYDYYASLQLIMVRNPNDYSLQELVEFVLRFNTKRISGPKLLLNEINVFTDDKYFVTNGHIMVYSNSADFVLEEVSFANEDDFEEIAHLICSDPSFANSYDESVLLKQLIKRRQEGCKSVFIKKDGKIVSHFSSFAVSDEIAVLSGMVTMPQYRGRGLGSILVKSLSSYYAKMNIVPVIYCYEDEYYSWYQKLGYKSVNDCAKLVQRSL